MWKKHVKKQFTFAFSECLMKKWQNEVNKCCTEMDRQTKLLLTPIEPELIRLLFDEKFKGYFLQKVNNRYFWAEDFISKLKLHDIELHCPLLKCQH